MDILRTHTLTQPRGRARERRRRDLVSKCARPSVKRYALAFSLACPCGVTRQKHQNKQASLLSSSLYRRPGTKCLQSRYYISLPFRPKKAFLLLCRRPKARKNISFSPAKDKRDAKTGGGGKGPFSPFLPSRVTKSSDRDEEIGGRYVRGYPS